MFERNVTIPRNPDYVGVKSYYGKDNEGRCSTFFILINKKNGESFEGNLIEFNGVARIRGKFLENQISFVKYKYVNKYTEDPGQKETFIGSKDKDFGGYYGEYINEKGESNQFEIEPDYRMDQSKNYKFSTN